MIRRSIVSGKFYPKNPIQLRHAIEDCFKNKDFGPGVIDTTALVDNGNQTHSSNAMAVICPHAGYQFSGFCAAHSFKAIKEAGNFDLFIVLGFSHSGYDEDKASTLSADWETPLGVAEIDKQLVEALTKDTSVVVNAVSIQNEHSIEVQIPFLQYLYPLYHTNAISRS
jgi:AmmeMemoRadiSam system protein B